MVRIGALLGLGIAYAGSAREDVRDKLFPFVSDTSATADMEIVAIAALALGIVYVGTSSRSAASEC
jgi:26S proteasome regulatory subunit N1